MALVDTADGVICFCTLIQFCPQTRVGHLLSIAVEQWGKAERMGLVGPPADVITVERHPGEQAGACMHTHTRACMHTLLATLESCLCACLHVCNKSPKPMPNLGLLCLHAVIKLQSHFMIFIKACVECDRQSGLTYVWLTF